MDKEAWTTWRINSFCIYLPEIYCCLVSYRHQAECWAIGQWTNTASIPPKSLQSDNKRGQRISTVGIAGACQKLCWHLLHPWTLRPTMQFSLFYVSVNWGSQWGDILPKVTWLKSDDPEFKPRSHSKTVQFSPLSFFKIQTGPEAALLPSGPSSVFLVYPICAIKCWMQMTIGPKQVRRFFLTT